LKEVFSIFGVEDSSKLNVSTFNKKKIMENFKLHDGISLTINYEPISSKEYWKNIFWIAFSIALVTLVGNPLMEAFRGRINPDTSTIDKLDTYLGIAFTLALSTGILFIPLSILFFIYRSIFDPVSFIDKGSTEMTLFENYILFGNNCCIPYDQIIRIRFKNESSSVRVKIIEVLIKDDFKSSNGFNFLETENLILRMEFRKDLYYIVDSLNKRIPKEKIEAFIN
jgi:hypothetical protein